MASVCLPPLMSETNFHTHTIIIDLLQLLLWSGSAGLNGSCISITIFHVLQFYRTYDLWIREDFISFHFNNMRCSCAFISSLCAVYEIFQVLHWGDLASVRLLQ
jgi:hypothetical protein